MQTLIPLPLGGVREGLSEKIEHGFFSSLSLGGVR